MDGLAGSWPLQVIDPTTLYDLPGFVLGPSVFGLVLLVGAVLVVRYDALLDRSIEASIDRPLSSLGYGVAAHLAIMLFSFYGISQLQQVSPSGYPLASVGFVVSLAILLVAAAVGFTVVGAAAVEFRWGRRRWAGLLLGASIAGFAVLVDPVLGGIVWIVVVSTGIGGSVRNWFNATDDVQSNR